MMGCWLRLHPRVRVWCPPRASSAPDAETCSRECFCTMKPQTSAEEKFPKWRGNHSEAGRRGLCGPGSRNVLRVRGRSFPPVWTQGRTHLHRQGHSGSDGGWQLEPPPAVSGGHWEPSAHCLRPRPAPRSPPRVAGNRRGPSLSAATSPCGRLQAPRPILSAALSRGRVCEHGLWGAGWLQGPHQPAPQASPGRLHL